MSMENNPPIQPKKIDEPIDQSLSKSFLSKEEFEQEIKKLYPEILIFCKKLLTSKVEASITAEDITQETFLNASRFYKDFRGESTLKTWLRTIATNCFYSSLRKAENDPLGKNRLKLENQWGNKKGEEDKDIPSSDFTPEEEFIYKTKKEEILKTIENLPERERKATKLNIFEGLGPAEISKVTGENQHTIGSSLNRARKKLSDLFGKKIEFRGRLKK